MCVWILCAVPSAQSIVVLAQRFGLRETSSELVVAFAWQYLFSIFTVTAMTYIGLSIF